MKRPAPWRERLDRLDRLGLGEKTRRMFGIYEGNPPQLVVSLVRESTQNDFNSDLGISVTKELPKDVPSLKPTFSHLKMDGWKDDPFLSGFGLFSGANC